MKDDLQTEFEQLVAQYKAQLDQAAQTLKSKEDAEHQFFANWNAVAAQTVMPALEEVASTLEKSGWTCRVTHIESPLQVVLEAHIGDMWALGSGHTRPKITFSPEIVSLEVLAHIQTQSHNGTEGRTLLSKLDADWVQSQALGFFKKLTGH